MADQDLEVRRACDLERYRLRTAERRAQGLCPKCGKQPPAPGRSQCEPCAAKKRPADRARHHRRTVERIAQGLCPKCGKQPPAAELGVCAPCAEKKRIAGRARDARLRAAGKPRRDHEQARAYERQRRCRQAAERLAAGLCPNCGEQPPAADASLCEPCSEKRREAERARYATGKAAGKLYGGRDPERAESWPARRAGDACANASKRACAPAAGTGRRPRRALRPVRRAGERSQVAHTQERRRPPALRPPARPRPLHRMRQAFARRGPVSAVHEDVLRALAIRPRHPRLGPAVHRDRAGHGRGLRDL